MCVRIACCAAPPYNMITIRKCVLNSVLKIDGNWKQVLFNSPEKQFKATGDLLLNPYFHYELTGTFNKNGVLVVSETWNEPLKESTSLLVAIGKAMVDKQILSSLNFTTFWLPLVNQNKEDRSNQVQRMLSKWSFLCSDLAFWLAPENYKRVWSLYENDNEILHWKRNDINKALAIASNPLTYHTLCFQRISKHTPQLAYSDTVEQLCGPFTDVQNTQLRYADWFLQLPHLIVPDSRAVESLVACGFLTTTVHGLVRTELLESLQRIRLFPISFAHVPTTKELNKQASLLKKKSCTFLCPPSTLCTPSSFHVPISTSAPTNSNSVAFLHVQDWAASQIAVAIQAIPTTTPLYFIGNCAKSKFQYNLLHFFGIHVDTDSCSRREDAFFLFKAERGPKLTISQFNQFIGYKGVVVGSAALANGFRSHNNWNVFKKKDRIVIDNSSVESVVRIFESSQKHSEKTVQNPGVPKQLLASTGSNCTPGKRKFIEVSNRVCLDWNAKRTKINHLERCSESNSFGLCETQLLYVSEVPPDSCCQKAMQRGCSELIVFSTVPTTPF